MNLRSLTTADLGKAHEAADCLLGLPARLDSELFIKLDTFHADLLAEIEDRGQTGLETCAGTVTLASRTTAE